MKAQEDVVRGARALVGNAAYKAVVEHIRATAHLQFAGSGLHDRETRESAYHQLRALAELEGLIEALSRDTEPRKGDS